MRDYRSVEVGRGEAVYASASAPARHTARLHLLSRDADPKMDAVEAQSDAVQQAL